MGSRFDPADRHSDDLVAAVDRAAHLINHTMAEGFGLIARQLAASHGTDNTPAIEASVAKIKNLTDTLYKSLQT
jgi:hypothetical protein